MNSMGRGPKPRVRPQMNTDTRRHATKSAYKRREKYRDDPLEDEDVQAELNDQGDDGGVLADFTEDEPDDEQKPDGGRS